MTKKDYIIIADVLKIAFIETRNIRAETSEEAGSRYVLLGAIKSIIRALALVMKKDNPRFNRRRFYDTCGLVGIPERNI